MLATAIALDTMMTQRCPACGTPHRIRGAVGYDDRAGAPELVGFFGRCPETGFREWFVVEVPGWQEGARVVAFGPPDDDTWEPADPEALERTWRSFIPEPLGPDPAPLVSFHPKGNRAARGESLRAYRSAIAETRAA